MTASPQPRRRGTSDLISDDACILPAHMTEGSDDKGPRFGDDVWEFRPWVPRTCRGSRCDFTSYTDPVTGRTAREYLYSRLRRVPARSGRQKPLKLTEAAPAEREFRNLMARLGELGVSRLSEVTHEHLDAGLRKWKAESPSLAYQCAATLKHIANHGPFLSDALAITPWPGRSAKSLAGLPARDENTTRRIPEAISGPLIKVAVFYVETASGDILAARAQMNALEKTRSGSSPGSKMLGHHRARERLVAYFASLRAQGRKVPAVSLRQRHRVPDAPVINGVVHAPSQQSIELLAGIGHNSSRHLWALVTEAGKELGYEAGAFTTPISDWPVTGRPWRPGLDPWSLRREFTHLRTACWVVIAFLSGMRDVEVRELGRDCAFTEPGDDGRIRYKIRGRVFKGRKLTGDEAEWVVLPIVHQAVEILRELNDDPTHLFGYYAGDRVGYALLSHVSLRLSNFRDHINELFSTADGPYIPNEIVTGEPSGLDGEDTEDYAGTHEMPWAFNSRQFRRTLAWYIAHQPFGIVAGARQYHHAKTTIFEGYAGTSASGFAAEVAAEEAVAKLDYLEDLYRDWDDGGPSSGGAAKTINAEFERIRRELGDLPGTVPRPARLRTMLAHLTKVLHPGILNDCFHNSATAVCEKRAKPMGRPLPMLNMCSVCPNSRRTAVHLPRLIVARDQAKTALDAPKGTSSLPPLQETALLDYIAGFDGLISELQSEVPA